MERYGGVEVQLYVFLTSTLNKGEWSASRTGHLTPEGRKSIAHWIGGCVGPKVGPDAVPKIKTSAPAENWTPFVQSVV
jgi:hypothetical protein